MKLLAALTLVVMLVGCGAPRPAPVLPNPIVMKAPEPAPDTEQHIFNVTRENMDGLAKACGFDRQTLNNSMRFQFQRYDFDWVVDVIWAKDVKKVYVADDANESDEHFRIDFKDCSIWVHPAYNVF